MSLVRSNRNADIGFLRSSNRYGGVMAPRLVMGWSSRVGKKQDNAFFPILRLPLHDKTDWE